MPRAARLQFLHLVAAHQNSGPKDPCAGALPLLASLAFCWEVMTPQAVRLQSSPLVYRSFESSLGEK